MANVETRSSPCAKHTRRIVCTLRVVIFLFGSFRLALKAPVRVGKFPNEIADRVSGYLLPTADHMVRAYYRVMLLRGCTRTRTGICKRTLVPPYAPPDSSKGMQMQQPFPESFSII